MYSDPARLHAYSDLVVRSAAMVVTPGRLLPLAQELEKNGDLFQAAKMWVCLSSTHYHNGLLLNEQSNGWHFHGIRLLQQLDDQGSDLPLHSRIVTYHCPPVKSAPGKANDAYLALELELRINGFQR